MYDVLLPCYLLVFIWSKGMIGNHAHWNKWVLPSHARDSSYRPSPELLGYQNDSTGGNLAVCQSELQGIDDRNLGWSRLQIRGYNPKGLYLTRGEGLTQTQDYCRAFLQCESLKFQSGFLLQMRSTDLWVGLQKAPCLNQPQWRNLLTDDSSPVVVVWEVPFCQRPPTMFLELSEMNSLDSRPHKLTNTPTLIPWMQKLRDQQPQIAKAPSPHASCPLNGHFFNWLDPIWFVMVWQSTSFCPANSNLVTFFSKDSAI